MAKINMRAVPKDPAADLRRQIEALRQEVRRLRSSGTQLANSTIGSSSGGSTGSLVLADGGSLVVDGGVVEMRDTDGSDIFWLGPQPQGDQGLLINRDDGSKAFGVRKPFAGSNAQNIQMYDAKGNTIYSEAALGAQGGHDAPYLQFPMQPVFPAPGGTPTCGIYGWERTTTSATFEDLFRWTGKRENAYSAWAWNIRFSDTTTACELQVVDGTGAILTGFFQPAWTGAVAAGSTADQELVPPYGLTLPGAFLDRIDLRVQARVTAGTGSVTVAVKMAQGAGG